MSGAVLEADLQEVSVGKGAYSCSYLKVYNVFGSWLAEKLHNCQTSKCAIGTVSIYLMTLTMERDLCIKKKRVM